tara:strand:- start:803 stop:1342 length:540 start_codon:yes stop_codon:yes gene_type:complete
MRKREEFRYNPIDFEKDRAIGLTLPLTNDSSAVTKFDVLFGSNETGSADLNLSNTDSFHGSSKSSTQGDFTLSYTTLEQAKTNLRNLVLTNKGERVMHPEFGCDIWASLFENITPKLISNMSDRIHKQVSIWLSYINILRVNIDRHPHNENRINIDITFALYNDSMNKETITIANVGTL